MTLGAFVRARREAAGLTRAALAVQVGWSDSSSVALIESGERDVPRDRLGVLLRALGVPEEEWGAVLSMPREATP